MDYSKILESKKIPKLFIFIDILVIVTLITISKIYFGFSFINLIMFFAYIIIWIQFPGRFFNRFFKLNFESVITLVLFQFLTGLIFLFLQYFFFELLHISNGIFFISPILFLVELYNTIKRHKKVQIKNIFTFNNSLLFTLFAVIFSISMLNLQFIYKLPEASSIISLNQDIVWHMGNINALAQGFPAMDPRVYGRIFRYHYFPDLTYAVCMRITGIPADTLLMSLAPYLIALITGSTIYSFAAEFINNKKFTVLFCYLSLFTGSAATYFLTRSRYPASLLLNHIITNVNGAAFGLSTAVIFVVILKKIILINPEDKKLYRTCILSGFLIMLLCTGMKGPFAAVLVLSLAFLCVYVIIIKNKNSKQIILFSILSIMAFLLVYYLIISGPQGAGGVSFSFTDTVKKSPFAQIFKNISYLLVIPVQFIFIIYGFSITFIIYFIYFLYMISSKERIEINNSIKNNNLMIFFFFSVSIIGTGAFYFLSQSGFSQIYFLFAAIPFIQMIGINYFFDIENHMKKSMAFIVRVFFIISIIYGLVNVLFGITNDAKPLYINVRNYYRTSNISKAKSGSSYITNNEYKAMIWIKNNTNEKSLIASDRQTLFNDGSYDEKEFLRNRYFYYSAYSQRGFFLEGYSYSGMSSEEISKKLRIIKLIYSKDYNNKYKLAKENNIDYIIVSKYIHPDLDISEKGIEKCYENPDVTVYEITRK